LGSRVRIPSPAPKNPKEIQGLSASGKNPPERLATEQSAKTRPKSAPNREKSVKSVRGTFASAVEARCAAPFEMEGMTDAAALIAANIPTVPAALKALTAMECELDSSETYAAIRKIERKAEVLKTLFREVAEVKAKAEDVVLLANKRIGEEAQAIPKASGRPPKITSTRASNLPKPTRADMGLNWSKSSRLQKLAKIPDTQLKAIATKIRAAGKDATVNAVLHELREDDIKAKRADYAARADRGATVADLITLAEADKKFACILCDPPWAFKVYSGKHKQRSAERYYDTSSLETIKALPVVPLAADDCALFLWCVIPELPGALEVIRAWGFEYKTAAFVWVKQNKGGEGLFTGMGYWTRANTEMCLLATRGSPQRIAKDVHQVVMEPVGEHSAKPQEVRRRIQRLLLGPYLELFARQAVPGWTCWGNEVAALRMQIDAEAAE
jgi:N6-adenosine-specific RNA methylase IME4